VISDGSPVFGDEHGLLGVNVASGVGADAPRVAARTAPALANDAIVAASAVDPRGSQLAYSSLDSTSLCGAPMTSRNSLTIGIP
jgi:hypothetical protein